MSRPSSLDQEGGRRRDDIDGLRAIAVTAVVLLHARLPGFEGGFVGVDVFFVISGFVIALSLERDIQRGRFSPTAFYERRIRRLLPALATVSLLTFGTGLWLIPAEMFEPFSTSLAFVAPFLSNVYFWQHSGYWDVASTLQPLLHTWSLAVEEQYYLVAPLALLLMAQKTRRQWNRGLVAVFAASLGVSLWTTATHPAAGFYLLPSRAWEILAGAALALRPPAAPGRATSEFLATAGAVLITASVAMYSAETPFPGTAAVLPCAGAALLIYAGSGLSTPLISRVLASRPVAAFGRLSYSLYLVHWPVGVLTHYFVMRRLQPVEQAAVVGLSVVLAAALHAGIERPLRYAAAPRRLVFGAAGVVLAMLLTAGLAGPHVLRAVRPAEVSAPPETLALHRRLWREGPCLLIDPPDVGRWNRTGCRRTDGVGPLTLLWGDSFAAHYTAGLEDLADRIQVPVLQFTAQGCPPILTEALTAEPCGRFNHAALGLIERDRISRVILAANWSEYRPADVARLDAVLDALKRLGAETTVIGQSPVFLMAPSLIVARQGHAHDVAASVSMDIDAPAINRALKAHTEASGAQFVDPLPALCPSEPCEVRAQGADRYLDYGHLTRSGSIQAVSAYFPYVER